MKMIILFLLSLMPLNIWANNLIQNIEANRDAQGGMVISGKTTLPPGTQITISLRKKNSKIIQGQSSVTIDSNEMFYSQPFTNGGNPWKDGKYDILFMTYFDTGQDPSVIAITGGDGVNLPASKDLMANDEEFPDNGKHLETIRHVIFSSDDVSNNDKQAEITAQGAIQAVNNATLYVKGKGKSADNIAGCLEMFKKAGGVEFNGWDAIQNSNVWTVTLSCLDGGTPKTASWSYNSKTKRVHYLDPLSKLLSWTPNY